MTKRCKDGIHIDEKCVSGVSRLLHNRGKKPEEAIVISVGK